MQPLFLHGGEVGRLQAQLLLLGGISLLWGSEWIVVPPTASIAAPFAVTALSLVLASSFLYGYAFVSRLRPPAVSFRASLLLSLTMFAGPLTLLFLAGKHGVNGWIPLLYSLLPLMLGFAGEGWTPAMVLAPAAVLVLLNGSVPFAPAKLPWAAVVLVAVMLQGFAIRFVRPHLSGRAVARSLGFQCALAAALLAVESVFFDSAPRLAPPTQWTSAGVVSLLLIAVTATALPYAGLYYLLTRGTLQPEQVAVAQWLQTLVAVAESAALMRVRPSWELWAAGMVLLGCAWAVLRPSAGPD